MSLVHVKTNSHVTFRLLPLEFSEIFLSIMAGHMFSEGNGETEYPNFLQNRLTLPPMQLRVIVPVLDRKAAHCYINKAVYTS